MKLSMFITYSDNFKTSVQQVQELESAGLDLVWVAEAYSFDSVSQMGYLAGKTSTIEIGAGILNVYSRTAACIGQTAAGLDYISDGRFVLGLGASGPQVIEGFHGVPYEKPMPRIRDYINVTRMTLRREKLQYDGSAVQIPLPAGQGTGQGIPLKLINHPVRSAVPIFWASLMGLSVKNTARYADGWLPTLFDPTKYRTVWGDDIDAGLEKRDPSLGPLQISAGGLVGIGDQFTGATQIKVLDKVRPHAALYVGGMGSREKNFYNTVFQRYGYEAEAKEIQDLYLSGKKDEAAAAIPADFIENSNLVGPAGYVKEQLAKFAEAGVTHLTVQPVGDPVKTIEQLKALL